MKFTLPVSTDASRPDEVGKPRTTFSRHRRRDLLLASASLLVVLALVFAGAFMRDLNHDEHQFIAPAALFLRAGLLPYRDFPCFHTPDLIFVFAALFTTTTHYLLAARSFNAGCASLLLLLVFVFGVRRFHHWFVALGFVAILALNPFFRFTAGRAWNHDLPTLALVVAFLAFLRAERSGRAFLWLVLCGAGVGLAAGTRLSFAPMVAPFVLAICCFPSVDRNRLLSLAHFGDGLALALLPVGLLFAFAPRQFLFDNFTYNHTINLLYREATVPREIAFWNKLSFPFQFFLRSPADVVLIAGFVWFAWRPWWRSGWTGWKQDRELTLLMLLLPFIFLGSWAPTPSYRQYYYPFVPFFLLGAMIGLAREPSWRWLSLPRMIWLTVIVSLLETAPSLPSPLGQLAPANWPVSRLHANAQAIAALVPRGRVLTLAPLFPLEAGREIYPEFATGPFAWRTASFMKPADRARFDFIGPAKLDDYLADDPPAAVLTGFEHREFEEPLLRYARDHGYQPRRLPAHGVLWIPAK